MVYRKRNKSQLTLDDFILPFGGKLKADNRWVHFSRMIPWDYIEDIYVKSMCEDNGAGTISSRIAFGAMFIKGYAKLTDEETVEYITENPYAQYFLGLHEFDQEPLFDPSMMVYFRRRFPSDTIDIINRRMFEQKANDKHDGAGGTTGSDDAGNNGAKDAGPDEETPQNHGELLLDATCAPADIRYPSDISLLNEARENTERYIDKIWESSNRHGHKTGYHRNKAHSEYLRIAKQKQPRARKLHTAIGKQLIYVKGNIDTLGELLAEAGAADKLGDRALTRITDICRIHRQQQMMWATQSRKCENRIVSLRQPHVRPIVRGKLGKKYEFGQKIALSVVSGYTFIEKQSFDNFNEGTGLITGVERYRKTYGYYPEAVMADKIYRNRENLEYCAKRGIRLSGPKLGRPRKNANPDRKTELSDLIKRIDIEGRIGTAKRRFNMDLIMAYLKETAMTEAGIKVLCMNARVKLFLFFSLRKWVRVHFLYQIFVRRYAFSPAL